MSSVSSRQNSEPGASGTSKRRRVDDDLPEDLIHQVVNFQLILEDKNQEIDRISRERDIARKRAAALEKQLQTLEAAVARLALTANATGRTALDRVNKINQILPDISRAGMGYGAALAFNVVRIHSGVDYSRFDVCERGLEREVEHSVEDMKEAGTDLADSFNHDVPIRHRIGWTN